MIEEISVAWAQDSHVRNSRISAEVNGDTIVLRGTVTSFYLKQMAQEIAMRRLNGSRGLWHLSNEIEVEQRGG